MAQSAVQNGPRGVGRQAGGAGGGKFSKDVAMGVLLLGKVSRRERELFIDNLLVCLYPLNHRNDSRRPALRHASLNPLFQVALYLPSCVVRQELPPGFWELGFGVLGSVWGFGSRGGGHIRPLPTTRTQGTCRCRSNMAHVG